MEQHWFAVLDEDDVSLRTLVLYVPDPSLVEAARRAHAGTREVRVGTLDDATLYARSGGRARAKHRAVYLVRDAKWSLITRVGR